MPRSGQGLSHKILRRFPATDIRTIFVAEEIPESLRRIIEFLTSQMSPAEVLGAEVPPYVSKEGIAYVPTLVGRTAAARSRKITASGG
jgi:hypothetical protein